jgi:hypothetical protein
MGLSAQLIAIRNESQKALERDKVREGNALSQCWRSFGDWLELAQWDGAFTVFLHKNASAWQGRQAQEDRIIPANVA